MLLLPSLLASVQFDTVRTMLDLGADPNAFGTKYTGNSYKDIKERTDNLKMKKEDIKEMNQEGASTNPFAKLWYNPTMGTIKLIKS